MAGTAKTGNVSLNSLSGQELDAINDLVNSQYTPEIKETSAAVNHADESILSEDISITVPWRERGGGQYPYLVRGAYLRCQHGSHMRRLNLTHSHGYYIKECPVMNAMDNMPGESVGNIPPFGVCKAPAGPKGVGTVMLKAEKNNPITGEPYRDAGGNALRIDDNVKGPPCTAVYMGLWQNPHQETLIGAVGETPYEAITTGSFLVCQYMGIVEPVTSGQPVLDPVSANPDSVSRLPMESPPPPDPEPGPRPDSMNPVISAKKIFSRVETVINGTTVMNTMMINDNLWSNTWGNADEIAAALGLSYNQISNSIKYNKQTIYASLLNGAYMFNVKDIAEMVGLGECISWWSDWSGMHVLVNKDLEYAPVKVIREGYNFTITAYAEFNGDYNQYIEQPVAIWPNIIIPGTTYKQAVINGIETYWSTPNIGAATSDDFNGASITVTTNVIDKSEQEASGHTNFVLFDIDSATAGTNQMWNANHGSWSIAGGKNVALYGASASTVDEFMRIAGHEFGHVVGIGDAYDYRKTGTSGASITTEVPYEDFMRYANNPSATVPPYVSTNDIEMMWEAYRTNTKQSFDNPKSSVIISY